MNSVTMFGQTVSDVVRTESKTGAVTVRNMTQKDYFESYGVKGAEGRRQYRDYLIANGKANGAIFAAAVTSGKVVVTGFKRNSEGDGGSVMYINADHKRLQAKPGRQPAAAKVTAAQEAAKAAEAKAAELQSKLDKALAALAALTPAQINAAAA